MRQAFEVALAASRSFAAEGPLERARALLDEPWRAAVIGRVGVGKTSFVNRRAGSRFPVGLGGVTREVRLVADGDRVWVDTPGIDDPYAATELLGPVIDRADAVVWVVDGLQPMTRSERDVARDTLPPGVPLWVVVSRVDLVDSGEVAAVVDRVRELAAPHRPVDVFAADLRAPDPALQPVGVGVLPGPRRREAWSAALAAVRAAAGPRPVVPGVAEVAERWRAEIRAVIRDLERRIAEGEVTHAVEALALLTARAPAVLEAVGRHAGEPRPRLPSPEAPAGGVFDQVVAGLSGASGALRALRTVGGRWVAEGETTIREGWAPAPARVARRDAHDALERALADLEAAR